MNRISSLFSFLADKIGNTTLGTTDTTISGAIAEIVSNLSGLTTVVNGHTTTLSDKVDKVSGKGLSTKDYSAGDQLVLQKLKLGKRYNPSSTSLTTTSWVQIASSTIPANNTSGDVGYLIIGTCTIGQFTSGTVQGICITIGSETTSTSAIPQEWARSPLDQSAHVAHTLVRYYNQPANASAVTIKMHASSSATGVSVSNVNLIMVPFNRT